jgi:hypothetical protein
VADETTLTTADDLTYSAVIEESVLEELRGIIVMPKMMRPKSGEGLSSTAFDYPKWPTLTASDLTEGTDLSNTAISTTKATITAAEVGLMAEITDVLEASDILNGLSEYSPVLARAVKTKIDADCCALLANTNSGTAVGSSGVDLTYANFLSGLTVAENANAHSAGQIVCVLHTQQGGDLRSNMGSTNTIFSQIDARKELYSNMAGYFGTLHEVDIFTDTNVPTANTAADRAGGFFVKGYTFGMATKWAVRVELERNASKRATEIVCTANYGVGELVDAAGCPIVTDA